MAFLEGYEGFSFDLLGDIEKARTNLGGSVSLFAYRMFLFSIRAVLEKNVGEQKANEIIKEAGRISGIEFCKKLMDKNLEVGKFLASLQFVFKELKIGIIRIEEMDEGLSNAYIVVEEDIDCSGMPVTGKAVCNYDEGLIEGILLEYTGKLYNVVEVDCWSTGARVCRFKVTGI